MNAPRFPAAVLVTGTLAMWVSFAMPMFAQDDTLTNVAPAAATATATEKVQLPQAAADVLKLTNAKINEEIVLAYIQNDTRGFGLTAPEIIYLQKQGVSDRVLTAMLNRSAASQPEQPPALEQIAPAPQVASTTNAPQFMTNYIPGVSSAVETIPSTVYVSTPAYYAFDGSWPSWYDTWPYWYSYYWWRPIYWYPCYAYTWYWGDWDYHHHHDGDGHHYYAHDGYHHRPGRDDNDGHYGRGGHDGRQPATGYYANTTRAERPTGYTGSAVRSPRPTSYYGSTARAAQPTGYTARQAEAGRPSSYWSKSGEGSSGARPARSASTETVTRQAAGRTSTWTPAARPTTPNSGGQAAPAARASRGIVSAPVQSPSVARAPATSYTAVNRATRSYAPSVARPTAPTTSIARPSAFSPVSRSVASAPAMRAPGVSSAPTISRSFTTPSVGAPSTRFSGGNFQPRSFSPNFGSGMASVGRPAMSAHSSFGGMRSAPSFSGGGGRAFSGGSAPRMSSGGFGGGGGSSHGGGSFGGGGRSR